VPWGDNCSFEVIAYDWRCNFSHLKHAELKLQTLNPQVWMVTIVLPITTDELVQYEPPQAMTSPSTYPDLDREMPP
jgi:hypothetical protein